VPLVWESTDQFGNLVVANSSAQSSEELRSDLGDLVESVFLRHVDESVTFSVDLEYGEVSAPRGDQVSHMVQVPWLAESGLTVEEVGVILESLETGQIFQVIGAWPM
jgi:hypothetical protein